jgi:hypothetical protein
MEHPEKDEELIPFNLPKGSEVYKKEESQREMRSPCIRTPGLWLSSIAVAVLSAAALSGCGGSSAPAGVGKGSSAVLDSAKQSLAVPTKVRGKTLPADANLSARERRALKKEGLLPQ